MKTQEIKEGWQKRKIRTARVEERIKRVSKEKKKEIEEGIKGENSEGVKRGENMKDRKEKDEREKINDSGN